MSNEPRDREQLVGKHAKDLGKKLKEYCHRKGLDVLKVFEITESSTVGDRRQFKEMLAYAKAGTVLSILKVKARRVLGIKRKKRTGS